MDKRKNNGGHSTKAVGVDRRKNLFKNVLASTLTSEQLGGVFKMLYNKAIEDEDVQAAKLIIEYAVGKPTQQLDVTGEHRISRDLISLVDFKDAEVIEEDE
ncbi:MAG: hypothetical protein GY823_00025 [Flavobacteriaceae bacterium]|jgi:hypothetical protein|nr:hypothetical protein [Flavobacteriaceae bacterium]